MKAKKLLAMILSLTMILGLCTVGAKAETEGRTLTLTFASAGSTTSSTCFVVKNGDEVLSESATLQTVFSTYVKENDTVVLPAGNIYGSTYCDDITKSVTLKGQGESTTTLYKLSNASARQLICVSNHETDASKKIVFNLQDITLDGSAKSDCQAIYLKGYLEVNLSNVTIQNCLNKAIFVEGIAATYSNLPEGVARSVWEGKGITINATGLTTKGNGSGGPVIMMETAPASGGTAPKNYDNVTMYSYFKYDNTCSFQERGTANPFFGAGANSYVGYKNCLVYKNNELEADLLPASAEVKTSAGVTKYFADATSALAFAKDNDTLYLYGDKVFEQDANLKITQKGLKVIGKCEEGQAKPLIKVGNGTVSADRGGGLLVEAENVTFDGIAFEDQGAKGFFWTAAISGNMGSGASLEGLTVKNCDFTVKDGATANFAISACTPTATIMKNTFNGYGAVVLAMVDNNPLNVYKFNDNTVTNCGAILRGAYWGHAHDADNAGKIEIMDNTISLSVGADATQAVTLTDYRNQQGAYTDSAIMDVTITGNAGLTCVRLCQLNQLDDANTPTLNVMGEDLVLMICYKNNELAEKLTNAGDIFYILNDVAEIPENLELVTNANSSVSEIKETTEVVIPETPVAPITIATAVVTNTATDPEAAPVYEKTSAAATVTFDTTAAKAIADAADLQTGERLELVVEKTNDTSDFEGAADFDAVFDISLFKVDDSTDEVIEKVSYTGGTATVRIPFTMAEELDPMTAKYGVFYIDDDGNRQLMDATYEGGYFIFTTSHFSYYGIIVTTSDEVAKKFKVTLVPQPADEAGNLSKWDIVVSSTDTYNNGSADVPCIINRLTAADFKFKLTILNGSVAYEITPAEFINLIPAAANTYEFNMDGLHASGISGESVTLGTVTFLGYGDIEFKVDETAPTTNRIHTTTFADNRVVTTAAGGNLTYDVTTAPTLTAPPTYTATTGPLTLETPKHNLTVNVAFPNDAQNNAKEYQDMTVTISGGDLIKPIVVNLGSNPAVDGKDFLNNAIGLISNAELASTDSVVSGVNVNYVSDATIVTTDYNGYRVVVNDVLTENFIYNVTISGAGYRTTRYNVLMNSDKVLTFWNNVMTLDTVIEAPALGHPAAISNTTAKITYLAGDIVEDYQINIYDLSAVVSYFGEVDLVTAKPEYVKYDLNRDGKIDSIDVAYVLVSWGK